ncbi:RELT-like protein 2 [Pleurodeles waltl]|uniref:RELT-like protein 2 n=1 Tax=Pleurodeles waltl TaxID=8319 RepID=UPI00370941C4
MAENDNMEAGKAEHQQNPYMLFLIVLVFFFMGLFGFLICHVLKKKGYRCRTSPEELDFETKEGLTEDQNNEEDLSNEDTVERIVKCIIQNEANTEALKQMLGENEKEAAAVPSFCPHRNSQDGGPPHHHTVHLGSTIAPCMHCSRKKKHPLQRMGRSKEGRSKPHPGEVTVFSVGRFRVTHIGKKSSIQGSQDESHPDTSNDTSTADKDPEEQSAKRSPDGATKNGAVQQEGRKLNGKDSKPCLHNAAVGTRGATDIRFVDFQAPVTRTPRTQAMTAKPKAVNEPKRRGSSPQQPATENVVLEMEEITVPQGFSFAPSADVSSSDLEANKGRPSTEGTHFQIGTPNKSASTE